jgi:hypothetical protein
MAWKFEHAVECRVPREFAWKYWTDVKNWDDPPARFETNGPFAVGTRVTTILPGQRLQSVIREVEEGRGARIEMEVADAVVAFQWGLNELANERTKLIQTVSLSGAGAESLAGQAKMLETTVPDGMKKLAEAMERKWAADSAARKVL